MGQANFVTISELLDRAAAAGVFLSYSPEGLHFKLSVDVFPETLKREIVANKEALLTFLRQRQLDDESTSSRPAIHTYNRALQPAVLSFAQQRLWFIDQLGGSSVPYNMPAALRIRGRFDEDVAEQSLRRIIERHEPLRTIFVNGEDGPRQHILTTFDFHLRRTDLSGLSSEAQEAAVSEALNSDAATAFDLCADLMLRASFIRLSAAEGVLLFNMHHIASDGWSMGILVSEFGQLYEAFSQGQPDPLRPLGIQYADYAQWQREWLAGEVLERQLSYWEKQLADLPQTHELPSAGARPPVQTYNGALHTLELQRDTLDGLKELALRSQTTLFMVLQGVFALLLSRYGNSDDIVMGVPVANRTQKELEPLVGFFVNTLVLRTDCRAGQTFREYLEHVRSVNLDAQANQDVPFEYLVERLKPQRSTSHGALFQIMFSMNMDEAVEAQLTALTMTPLRSERVAVKFDLTLEAKEHAEGLSLSFAYNRDLFEAATIARMGEHLRNLVRGVVAEPEAKIEMLPLLSEGERQHLLYDLNETAVTYAGDDPCLHEMFEAQVERSPEAVAVVFEEQRLSYRELNEQANQLAHYLKNLGVGPEAPVALFTERGIEMIIALLAVLKAGAAYLPLDPSYPQERLSFMLQDSEAQVLLTQKSLLAQLPTYEGTVVKVDEWEVIAGESSDNLKGVATAESLAYLIYTSGSTGRPKGVLATHRGAVNRFRWMWQQFPFDTADVCCMKTSLSFVDSVWECFGPLLAGVRTVIVPDRLVTDVEAFVALLDRQKVTRVVLVPSLLDTLISHYPNLGTILPALKLWVSSGEPLSSSLVDAFAEAVPDSVLVNLYGCSEVAADVTWHVCDSHRDGRTVPIGQPIANMQIYVLDGHMNAVPVEVPGEIYVGGYGLARGYLKCHDLTAERFVPNPFGVEADERLYRTGDLARWLPDGSLELIGRRDNQVKLRGYRIELGEIEQQLGRIAGVSAAVVLMREDVPGQRMLVGYVTMEEGVLEGAGEVELISGLRKGLQAQLPDYMVPSVFVILDDFPLTPNGKLDRKALPMPEPFAPAAREPSSPVEEILCSIFCQVLRLENITLLDNFFELGGHSLLATQVISRIRNTFSVDLPLRILFESPTVADLAPRVQLAMQVEPGVQAPPMAPVDRSKPLPLSYAQQRLWFIDQLESGTSLYNIPVTLKLTGELNIAAVASSLNELVRRHEVLRTYFLADIEPMQVIGDYQPLHLDVIDLSAEIDFEQIDSRIELLAYQEAQQPFDLSVGPLLRVKLLRLADDQHILLITMHHIISDGWSFTILIREFSTLYEAFVSDRPAGLVDLPIQYADFAVWQRSWLQGDVLENQLDYWRRQLDSLTALELPLDFPRPAEASHRGRMITFQIPEELTRKLKQLSRQHSATLFATLLTAFQVLLSRYSNQSDVAVGTDIANRNRLETESLIGFFVNQLVLRADLSANPSFIDLLQQVRRTALDAYVHQDLPFEKLVDELQPQRDLSRAPLFQVKLVLQNAAGVDLHLPALRISSLEEQHQVAKFDLTFIFEESSSAIKGSLEFATDLFSSATAHRIVSHFCTLLESITDDPSQRVRDLSLLTQEERNQLLFDFNDTSRSFPRSSGVHQLFESQTEVSPEAVAVVFGDQFLSYRQLNEQANQLAHYLRSLGVGAEVRVAVYMERSIEMIVALLSILKAGGAYVPIDPEYPMERVAWLLEDSQCPVLLTQERLQDSLPSVWSHVLCVDSEWEEVRSFSTRNPETFVSSDNLSYVMYTSGSTGSPKGVEVTHKSIVRLLMSTGYAQFGPSLAFLQISPPSFDASTLEIWAPLLHGGRCILYPERIPIPERLAEFILDHKVNSAWLTSSLFNAFMDEMPLALAPLQQLLIGGEALSVSHVSKAVQMLGSTCLINGYGPTEGTTFTCCYRIPAEPGALTKIRSVPIGPAISNSRVYILDSEYEPVPIGVPGELFIAGDGLARGYLNQPGLTAEKFLPDPFSQETGGRLYRTGDIARWRADGSVEYLTRMDHQVKLRGYRIELGEIESNLRRSPVVQDVAVLLREDVMGDKRLVAYIIPSSPSWEDPGSLRAYLQQTLPDYMVPAHFVVLDEMPLTPNGKLDRKALLAPDAEDVQTGLYVEPSNATEQAMCEVWQEVLKLDRVGVEENFFSLGGDSILSIQVVSMLKSRDIVVDIKDIFKHQTIAQLAAQIEPGRREQEIFIGTNEIAHLLINESDELGANVSETIL